MYDPNVEEQQVKELIKGLLIDTYMTGKPKYHPIEEFRLDIRSGFSIGEKRLDDILQAMVKENIITVVTDKKHGLCYQWNPTTEDDVPEEESKPEPHPETKLLEDLKEATVVAITKNHAVVTYLSKYLGTLSIFDAETGDGKILKRLCGETLTLPSSHISKILNLNSSLQEILRTLDMEEKEG